MRCRSSLHVPGSLDNLELLPVGRLDRGKCTEVVLSPRHGLAFLDLLFSSGRSCSVVSFVATYSTGRRARVVLSSFPTNMTLSP